MVSEVLVHPEAIGLAIGLEGRAIGFSSKRVYNSQPRLNHIEARVLEFRQSTADLGLVTGTCVNDTADDQFPSPSRIDCDELSPAGFDSVRSTGLRVQ